MEVFCLTEHMPRSREDWYPEEVSILVLALLSSLQDSCLSYHVFKSAGLWLLSTGLSHVTVQSILAMKQRTSLKPSVCVKNMPRRFRSSSALKRTGFALWWGWWIVEINHRLPDQISIRFLRWVYPPYAYYPVDYDHDCNVQARERAGGSDERLYEDYFLMSNSPYYSSWNRWSLVISIWSLKSEDPEKEFDAVARSVESDSKGI